MDVRAAGLIVALAAVCPAIAHDIDRPVAPAAAAAPIGTHPSEPCRAAGYPTRHDRLIRRAWLKHGGARWAHRHCGWRAQLMAESSGDPDAESAADAVGLGQQIPAAAADCRAAGLKGSRREARWSAHCGAWLMRRAGDVWHAPRSEACRIELARGCYISGCGRLIRAQTIARARGRVARCWHDGIGEFIGQIISSASAAAAREYVDRVAALERRMTP